MRCTVRASLSSDKVRRGDHLKTAKKLGFLRTVLARAERVSNQETQCPPASDSPFRSNWGIVYSHRLSQNLGSIRLDGLTSVAYALQCTLTSRPGISKKHRARLFGIAGEFSALEPMP